MRRSIVILALTLLPMMASAKHITTPLVIPSTLLSTYKRTSTAPLAQQRVGITLKEQLDKQCDGLNGNKKVTTLDPQDINKRSSTNLARFCQSRSAPSSSSSSSKPMARASRRIRSTLNSCNSTSARTDSGTGAQICTK